MKQIFMLEGLDCAHCASKIENALKKQNGIFDARVNFITGKMTIEHEDSKRDVIIKAVHDIIRKLEPDAVVTET